MAGENKIIFDPEDEAEGFYAFDVMPDAMQAMQQEPQHIVRPGVAGHILRLTGARGQPFQFRTIHYVADFEACRDALVAYQALVNGDPVYIIANDVEFGWFHVLRVDQAPPAPCSSAIGTLVSNPTAMHLVIWTLVATAAPP